MVFSDELLHKIKLWKHMWIIVLQLPSPRTRRPEDASTLSLCKGI
jgi:hypothetical protein